MKPTPSVNSKSSAGGVSIPRQVQIIAGISALVAAVLTAYVNSSFIYLSGFVGVLLILAGTSGFCAVSKILGHMPWNKGVQDAESCH